MLFNSPVFLFAFLPTTLLLYFALARSGRARLAQGFLVAASLFFYAWWRPSYLLLLVGSIAINFAIGTRLVRLPSRGLLAAGIAFDLGLLGVFKYADFALSNWNVLAGPGSALPELGILLPLAISFFTFQQIAYLVDCHQAKVGEHGALDYALFVTFFPQLIAGPIVHHSETIPQFQDPSRQRARPENLARGSFVFALGLFKKVVIADTFAIWANPGFDPSASLGLLQAWAASLSYTFQLYFDFSGYTDMALGAAFMFNVRLPINFDSPYKASSIQDFWRRWHITLSRFLRDYLYIPLGGNRRGTQRAQINLMIVMLLGGLWHGAGWTFVVWGGLHGAALVLQRGWQALGLRMHAAVGWLLTFLFVNAAWVFFRATSLAEASRVLHAMAGQGGSGLEALAQSVGEPASWFAGEAAFVCTPATLVWLVVFGGAAFLLPNSNELAAESVHAANARASRVPTFGFRLGGRSGLFAGSLAAMAIARLLLIEGSEFLYFNF